MATQLRRLPGDVLDLLAVRGGIFTARDAQAKGITLNRLRRLREAGLLMRLARGVYAEVETSENAGPWSAFALRSRAFTLAHGPNAYAAGWSAVAIHGLPTISPPPARPVVIVADSRGRLDDDTCYGRVRSSQLPSTHRSLVDECQVTSIERTVIDIARTAPRDEALVVADAALAWGLERESLLSVVDDAYRWPGVAAAAWIVGHADPYSETAIETLGRLAFIEGDLPVPISNAWIELGSRRVRPDHLLDDLWMVFEGDGAQKYNNRVDAGSVIDQQREREWWLRNAGFEIGVRYGWKLARYDRTGLTKRIRASIANRPPRPRRCEWYRDPLTYRLGR